MDKKTLIEGIAVGAVAGAIAGLLLAPKSGQETRDEIKADLMEIRDKIVGKITERLETVEDFTQEKYQEVVQAVIGEYTAAKTITLEQAKELEARLWDGHDAIRQTIHEHTAPKEPPTAV